jgi:hypothetical protein
LYSLLVVIVIPFSLSWMSYNPMVQTFLARMASSYLSDQLNTVIRIEGLYITPRLDFHVTGMLAEDQRADTLFHAGDIFVDMSSLRLSQSGKFFKVNDIRMRDASFALIKNVNDSLFTYEFIRTHFQTTDPAADTVAAVATADNWQVSLHALKLERFRFRFIDETREREPVGMDYTNLDIYIDELRLQDLRIHNDTFNFMIENLACKDHCGFEVDALSGDFRLSPLFLYADSLLVKTPNSDLSLDLAFDYNGWPSYIEFVSEVTMNSDIRPSELNLVDIGYFAPDLLVMDNSMRIGGQVRGTVDKLRLKDFRFTYGRNTRFSGDIRLYGLPDVEETFIRTSVDDFTMTRADIESFAIPGDIRYIPVPDELGVLGTMNIKGSFTGFYNDFVSTAEFNSDIGTITTDVSLKQNKARSDVVYEGRVYARRFHIGKFLNLDTYFGELDLEANIIGSGLTANTANINITGTIDSLAFMGEIFNSVQIKGNVAENQFNGSLDVKDELVNLLFDGILDFRQDKPLLNFTADITDADLFGLNMLDRDSLLLLSARLNCNFIGIDPEDLEGRILIDSLEYLEGEKRWFMNHLALISLKDTGYYRNIMLSSDFADAEIKGNYTIREISWATDSLLREHFPQWAFLPEEERSFREQQLAFSVDIKETEDLLDIFVPGLKIQDYSSITGTFNSAGKKAGMDAVFPRIEYLGMSSDTLRIMLDAASDQLALRVNTQKFLLKEKERGDTLELGMQGLNFDAIMVNDSLLFALGWANKSSNKRNSADIEAYYTYLNDSISELRFTRAMAYINDSLWRIDTAGRTLFGWRYLEFDNVKIKGGHQALLMHGKISEAQDDTLLVSFDKWRLSNFDILYRNYNFDLNGVISGNFGLNNMYGLPNFFSALRIDGLEMNSVAIGDAVINSHWNHETESIDLGADIIYHGNVADSKVMHLAGSYKPLRSDDNLSFNLEMNNFHLEALRSFVKGFVSDIDGVLSAKMTISGSTQKPKVTGSMKFMRTSCRIDYLNTKYSFAHTIDFFPGVISISNMIVYDSVGNQAVANGAITHKNLSDFYFDIKLQPEDFICLYTKRYQNKTFYGDGIVSGQVNFYGPPDNFHIDANVQSARGADITIPLDNSFTVTDNDFVIFTNVEQEDEKQPDYNVDVKGLNLDFRIGINNTAETMIFLPGNMGNISSRGYGDIRFTINPRGQFNIYGDYNFLHGWFFFSLQNLINRRFEILQGGNISFTGNPFNADVDLKALYRLKTNLSGLGASISPELEGQRVNVNAYLRLKGKLANPDIRFSIDFPNVKDEIKSTIYAVLDTNDAVMMNQQMVSLLLMNSFSYASSSANMAGSSLNIVTSQLSNWLSQISRDFDIGINYIAGDEMNQDELEVALSTQFFDNRLIVDGNVGVMTGENTTQQDASNIVGDVNIEYKLRPDGRIRLRAFNRSNNINTLDYYAPYTQGVGIFYTKEFDRFGDIFKRQKKRELEE